MDVFELPFFQRGLWELAALAVGAGLLGTWIVLRGLAFHAHAAGTAAFPGLVLADGLGFAAALGALGTAGLLAGTVGWLARRDREAHDSLTALVLVGALVAGVILASDVFSSGAQVEQLLFGSLLLVDGGDIALAAAASAVVLAGTLVLGPRWLAAGFDEGGARALGIPSGAHDAVLLALIALTAVAALSAVGALLATSLLVVPAATTRLLCTRMLTWQVATVALVLAEGVGGLWLSVELNAPPGATIAVLAGAVFGVVALGRRGAALMAAVALAGGLAACGSDDGGGGGRVQVVASTTHLADLARQVGGERVQVTGLLAPNTDPHDYEPRPDDVRAVAGADVFLVSGRGLDDWASEVAEQAGGARVVEVGAHVPHPREDDPHWWQDPRNIEAAAQLIAREVRGDAAPFVERLRRADRQVAACFDRVPAARRKLVTDHDAFGSFAARYGLEVVGTVIPARTTQAQPSAGDLADLARTIRREGVRAVFPEAQLEPRLAEAIARRTGAAVDFRLYSDALGPRGSDGDTVLGAFAHNGREIVRGLSDGRQSCEVSAG